jgi:MFS family permease
VCRQETCQVASRPYRAFGLLGLFVLLHVLNQVDRNLISSFGPEIVAALGLTRTQFGIIAGLAFTVPYALTALTAGILADRYGRTRIMAAGLMTWSGFTAASGLARSFATLALVRPFVATGEATLIPAATALLSERFPAERRATAIGVFFMGLPLGVGASFFIAGRLGPVLGWRHVFILLGLIGVVLSAVVLRLRDGKAALPGAETAPAPSARMILADLSREFRTNSDFRLSLLGAILMHVYLAGSPFVKIWLVEERGFRGDLIASTYGLAVIVFGLLGAGLGGTASDWYARRFAGGRAAFLAIFIAILAPLIVAFRFAAPGSGLFYAGMGAGIVFFSAFYGPAFAVLQSVTPTRLHASATGLTMLLVNVVALGLGGLAIGAASDHLARHGSHFALTGPLFVADMISLLTIPCFAVIGWRARRAHSGAV